MIGSRLEKLLSTTLTFWAWVLVIVLSVNYFTRLVVRYSEARGIIPKTQGYNQENLVSIRTPIGLVTTLLNDAIETVKLFAYKTSLWVNATIQFFLLNENRDITKVDEITRPKEVFVAEKEVYLIRHGQSVWNLIFNESSLWELPVRLCITIIAEALLYCEHDSLFMDSPLSSGGLAQCAELKRWIENRGEGEQSYGPVEERIAFSRIMSGEAKAVFATSNLRRTISTLMNSFGSAVASLSALNVYILSDLQEATRNVDSFSICSDVKSSVSTLEKAFNRTPDLYLKANFISVYNNGNKSISTTLKGRQTKFVDWLFESSVNIDQNIPVVVSCHSLYARNLFRRFLPINHTGKQNKIQNCGAVKVVFQQWKDPSGETFCIIDESRIIPIYKGFN